MILATALGASACGFFHHGGTPVDNTSITAAEIDSVHAASAYDAVRKLRPQFLEPRGRMSVDLKVPPGASAAVHLPAAGGGEGPVQDVRAGTHGVTSKLR